MLFGYTVLMPVIALLFDDKEDVAKWLGDEVKETMNSHEPTADKTEDDILATFRDRYVRGELTDDQFKRKLERLLKIETLEDIEDEDRNSLTEQENETGGTYAKHNS